MTYGKKRTEAIAGNLFELHKIGNYLRGISPQTRRDFVLNLLASERVLEGHRALDLFEQLGAGEFSKSRLNSAIYRGTQGSATATGISQTEIEIDIHQRLERAARCYEELRLLGF